MGVIELCEVITKALADGKRVMYDYSDGDMTGYGSGWAHVDSAIVDGIYLDLELNNNDNAWPISVSGSDQPAIDDFIARIAIYDTLLAPKDVVLGTGKMTLHDSNLLLSVTGIQPLYKVENTGIKIDGFGEKHVYEI